MLVQKFHVYYSHIFNCHFAMFSLYLQSRMILRVSANEILVVYKADMTWRQRRGVFPFSILIEWQVRCCPINGGRRLYLNPRKELTINPKKSKKNHLYLYTIQLNYATSTLDLTINQKNRIKITFIYTP